jgi:hypothetical protein
MKQFLILMLSLFAMLATAKTAPAADLAGKWHFVLDTPGGDREVDATFALDGEQVTGKWGDANVAGTFKEGKIDADALSGTWEFSEYNGTFKATRKE